MRTIPVLQIGVGGVGRALAKQVLQFNQHIAKRYDLQFTYVGLVDRAGAVVKVDPSILADVIEVKRTGGTLGDLPAGQPLHDWRALLPSTPCIVVDVTAQDGIETALAQAVTDGHRVVLANKKPLCASYDLFTTLTEGQRTHYEATVGAGLPVIATLRSLLDTGDVVQSIEGCLSGTLGFLMSQLEKGVGFADAVIDAQQRGWTEPDPRDDLNGIDVARKALILARTCGFTAELSDIEVESLYPASLATVSLEAFVAQLPTLNDGYRDRLDAAAGEGTTLRYVARIAADGQQVGVKNVAPDSPTGALRGPDNLVVYRTQRYNERPLSIAGPGAGTEVTASAVLADMVKHGLQWR
jgi:homoserine dehydrogenase